MGPCFPSDETADGPSINIISANVTSLRKNWDSVKTLDSSLYFLQETTLNKQGQNAMAMARTISRDNHNVTFGLPCGYKFSGSQSSISLWNAKSGGLASIAKKPLPLKDIKSTTFMFEIGRATHTWVPCGPGRRGFHIINCYGYVGAGTKNPHAFALNEKLLSSVFEYAASLGGHPMDDCWRSPNKSRSFAQCLAHYVPTTLFMIWVQFSRTLSGPIRKVKMRTFEHSIDLAPLQ